MLFLDAEEMTVGIVVGEDHRLATEGSDFGAADIEHITEAGQLRQGDVTSLGEESVTESGSIYIKRYMEPLAYGIDIFQFLLGIKGAQFGGESDVDQSRIDTVGIVAVVVEIVQILLECLGFHLAVNVGQGDNLVFGKLDCTCLMHIDMSGIDSYHSLVLIEQRVDDGGVGLCTAREEEDVGFGILARQFDFLLGHVGKDVKAIGCSLLVIGFQQSFQHFLVCSIAVVILE